MIDWNAMRLLLARRAAIAINGELEYGMSRALKDVPVRSVFRGGRRNIRFKTAAEVERDADLRARLGLAPEIVATPEAVAAVRRRSIGQFGSTRIGGEEFGFARTIEHPRRGTYKDKSGRTPAERGLTRLARNRANATGPGGEIPETRIVDRGSIRQREYEQELLGAARSPLRLADEDAEARLSARGRYELRTGRAVSQRTRTVTTGTHLDRSTGRITVETARVPVGPAYLGGGLRSTIRIDRASPNQYPELQGWLLAGDEEHDYAKYQELGTRHNPAHPFLRPRLPEWRERLPSALERSLGRLGR